MSPEYEDIPPADDGGYSMWQQGQLVAQIEIRRTLVLGEDDAMHDIIEMHHRGPDDEDLPLIEVLGLLELAKDTAIRQAMGEIPDEDDD